MTLYRTNGSCRLKHAPTAKAIPLRTISMLFVLECLSRASGRGYVKIYTNGLVAVSQPHPNCVLKWTRDGIQVNSFFYTAHCKVDPTIIEQLFQVNTWNIVLNA